MFPKLPGGTFVLLVCPLCPLNTTEAHGTDGSGLENGLFQTGSLVAEMVALRSKKGTGLLMRLVGSDRGGTHKHTKQTWHTEALARTHARTHKYRDESHKREG